MLLNSVGQIYKYISNRAQVVYQYGHQVPRHHADAMRLERINGNNSRWAESEKLEAQQLIDYEA